MSIKNKIKKCLDEGEKGGERHKGLKNVAQNTEKAKGHLAKAIKNFNAITDFHDMQYSDWSASAAFYALYQGLLAILSLNGFESRNQSCTFTIIEDLILRQELKELTVEDLRKIFDKSVTEQLEHSDKILDLREEMQYSTKTTLAEQEFQHLKQKTKMLFDKIRTEIETKLS
ncbi:hypothetical protein HZA97_04530 [Candidatus Woesearchaeota archaeon]|nr:hypothetical protein [Candidatus Woesearchaeota archaeon]